MEVVLQGLTTKAMRGSRGWNLLLERRGNKFRNTVQEKGRNCPAIVKAAVKHRRQFVNALPARHSPRRAPYRKVVLLAGKLPTRVSSANLVKRF